MQTLVPLSTRSKPLPRKMHSLCSFAEPASTHSMQLATDPCSSCPVYSRLKRSLQRQLRIVLFRHKDTIFSLTWCPLLLYLRDRPQQNHRVRTPGSAENEPMCSGLAEQYDQERILSLHSNNAARLSQLLT